MYLNSLPRSARLHVPGAFLFSVSMGVTNLVAHDTFDEILGRVDKLLYSAKQAGRNMFVCG
jgi:PleD family two-component response regulator